VFRFIIEQQYELNPNEIMSKMYEPAQDVYKNTMQQLNLSRKDKVLNSVAQFGGIDDNGILNNKEYRRI
jgi:hypothetical protein